jgi:hypothetical protein
MLKGKVLLKFGDKTFHSHMDQFDQAFIKTATWYLPKCLEVRSNACDGFDSSCHRSLDDSEDTKKYVSGGFGSFAEGSLG